MEMNKNQSVITIAAHIMADMGDGLYPCPQTEFGICYDLVDCDGFVDCRAANSVACWKLHILATMEEEKARTE